MSIVEIVLKTIWVYMGDFLFKMDVWAIFGVPCKLNTFINKIKLLLTKNKIRFNVFDLLQSYYFSS